MKVIDLLVKNANGEEMPKIISFRNERYIWDGYGYQSIDSTAIDDEGDEYAPKLLSGLNLFHPNVINDDVEIIEGIEKPKKIEHIKKNQNRNDKINEIIDSVNYLLEKSKDDEV